MLIADKFRPLDSIQNRHRTDEYGKKMTEQKHKDEENKIKKHFLRTLGPTALHEMTTTSISKKKCRHEFTTAEYSLPRTLSTDEKYLL